jgi:hypothetical protein
VPDNRATRSILVRVLREAAWAPLAVLVSYAVLPATPFQPDLYWPLHFLGGAAMAFFFLQVLQMAGSVPGTLRSVGRYLAAFAAACTVTVFWEIAEFAWDQLTGSRLQRDLQETMGDLIFAVLGTASALGLMAIARRLTGR